MSIEIVTYFSTLCRLARNEYKAEINGNKKEIETAKNAHEAYRQLCLKSNKMIISANKGNRN